MAHGCLHLPESKRFLLLSKAMMENDSKGGSAFGRLWLTCQRGPQVLLWANLEATLQKPYAHLLVRLIKHPCWIFRNKKCEFGKPPVSTAATLNLRRHVV